MSIVKKRTRIGRWLLNEHRSQDSTHHPTHPWWQVMCLTGVDYFSTLGYQPGIAALAAGSLSPIATLILVLLTLFGALPIYRRVATISPHGEGSISMLAQLLSWWQGKLFVLCLLGFVATDFIITITLSAADASAHITENPLVHQWAAGNEVIITLLLIALLGGVFLRGFQEAVGLAVVLVVVYLSLNLIVIIVGIGHIIQNPAVLTNWQRELFTSHGNPVMMLAASALLFPKLALGLSGFETGVAVMPLVAGDPGETEDNPVGRIRNTYKLLTVAALIMSFFLLTSSLITTVLIPAAEFKAGGPANGRALAYLSHKFLGDGFGTVYDLSTIAILWFAGSSAMAGLLNIVPRYLPRYGMAPDWARATRPLVLVFTAIAFIVTIIFNANVEAQGGAYATGVLVLMSSAAFAVTLSVRKGSNASISRTSMFSVITLLFIYTTIVNIVERPDGLKIASLFIGSIVIVSLVSRVMRSTELRVDNIELDEVARNFIAQDTKDTVRLIAHRKQVGDEKEYYEKEREVRDDNHIPETDSVLFLEIQISDASEFVQKVEVQGARVGSYRILRAKGSAVPNTIAAILLDIRNRNETDRYPHAYFGWAEGNPIKYLLRFLLFGEGDTAVVTREVLRRAEPDPSRRPGIHVGG
ncbi:amino acid transporter [Chamaesiphon sp. VAR_48_metabat_135_sub]|uniref:amino acid transporter n=1 Tax=Chamaesiphon sp. VAR_48_metabat_135_sub TaxID=2964699 RepID=UPI00286ABB55|nr:amino acid transporter [Chamaesiphon sp. VAR_48_metabat_135_sub]